MTSPFNPYQPPASDALLPEQGQHGPSSHLASRWERLGAAFIDGLIAMVVIGPLQWKFGMFDNMFTRPKPTFTESATWGAVAFVVWLLENGYFLITSSQTIGKRVVGIRVENVTGGRAEAWKLVVLRHLPISMVSQIPMVGPVLALLDDLLVFRKDHRCLHDLIAGTVVVRAN